MKPRALFILRMKQERAGALDGFGGEETVICILLWYAVCTSGVRT